MFGIKTYWNKTKHYAGNQVCTCTHACVYTHSVTSTDGEDRKRKVANMHQRRHHFIIDNVHFAKENRTWNDQNLTINLYNDCVMSYWKGFGLIFTFSINVRISSLHQFPRQNWTKNNNKHTHTHYNKYQTKWQQKPNDYVKVFFANLFVVDG